MNADDLLRRALESLKDAKSEIADWGAYADEYFQKKWDYEGSIAQFDPLIEEIRAYLDAPKDEPVAWIDMTDRDLKELHQLEQFGLFCDADEFIDMSRTVLAKFKYHNKRHLPTKAAPMKPMTDEEITKVTNWPEYSHTYRVGFLDGVRFAERHHGIGGGDE